MLNNRGLSTGERILRILTAIVKYFLLIFASFLCIIPIVSCVVTAFKTEEEYASTNIMTLPQNWSISRIS
jgi:multiple sugar transport system permease protein